jgi:raffinose/stachyose/melibiose transport system substrate-binding protein
VAAGLVHLGIDADCADIRNPARREVMKSPIRLTLPAVTAAALALSGCSGGGDESAAPSNGAIGGKVTVVFDATFKRALDPVVQAFEKKYPGTKVDVNYMGGDISAVVLTQLQAGTAPDIFITFPGGTPGAGGGTGTVTLASQQRVLDLSDSPWASAVPKTWKSDVEYEGKTYAYPGALQGLGATYNATKLQELGLSIPKTWSEVLSLCDAAKSKGIYAYGQGLSDAGHMIYLALSSTLIYGPTPDFDQQQLDGKVTFDGSPWKEVFEKYVEMNKRGCFGDGAVGRSSQQGLDAVAAGKALGVVSVGAVLSILRASAPNNKYTLAALPATDSPDETYMPALPGYTISLNAQSKNPATAKAFLDVLAEPENINNYAAGFESIPVIPNGKFKAPDTLAAFNDAVVKGKSTKIPNWPTAELQTQAMQEVQSVLLGRESIDTALNKLQKTFDSAKK